MYNQITKLMLLKLVSRPFKFHHYLLPLMCINYMN